jgi:hypothetical protein
MTITEDYFAPWQGSTAPTKDKSANLLGELRITGGADPSLEAPDYADDIENIIDIFTRRRYIHEVDATSSANIDYMRTDISDYVKISSENRTKMVPLDLVARGASGIVGVLCIASLIFGSISKFQMVHPFVAVVFLAAAIFVYATTTLVPRK